MPAAPPGADALLARTLELSVPLHPGIAVFDEPAATYSLAGAPGVALFRRDHPERIVHTSGTPSPALAPVLEELHRRHNALAGLADAADNSHTLPLVLLCLYLADEEAGARLELPTLARRPASIEAMDEDAATHDPELELDDGALRAWIPLQAAHAPQAGAHPAILQMRFHANRSPRYAPW